MSTKRRSLSVVTVQCRDGSWLADMAGSGPGLGSLLRPLNQVLERGVGSRVCIPLDPVNFYYEDDVSIVFHGPELEILHIASGASTLHFDILAQTGQLVFAGGSEALERFKTGLFRYGDEPECKFLLMCEDWGGSKPPMPDLANEPHAPSFTAIHRLRVYGGGDWVPPAVPLPQGAVVGPRPPLSKE